MKRLDEIFFIEYGNQLDLNKCERCQVSEGVNFVNRSAANSGVSARIMLPDGEKAYPAGYMTSAMGGSVLATFVQQDIFVTGQNVKVLWPQSEMSLGEKLFYCACIEANRFRFTAFGREANATFESILVPDRNEMPEYVHGFELKNFKKELFMRFDFSKLEEKAELSSTEVNLVPLEALFEVENGVNVSNFLRLKQRIDYNWIPIIRPSYKQSTSIDAYVDRTEVPSAKIFSKGTLYVSTNGEGSHTYAYVSREEFVPNSDVSVLLPKRQMTLREKLFYAFCISQNRYKFSYGRKPKGDKLKAILLPDRILKKYNDCNLQSFAHI